MTRLRLELRASRALAGALVLVHGAGAAAALLTLPGALAPGLAAALLALGAAALWRRALLRAPGSVRVVELAEDAIADRLTRAPRALGAAPIPVVDVGTGSGTIAVALAVALRRRGMLGAVSILATDISEDALGVAAENVVAHVVADAVRLQAADLLPPDGVLFDLVLANLPYVRADVIPTLPVATSFEPTVALDGGPDGLAVIRRLLALLPTRLSDDGLALLEIGADQGDAIAATVARNPPARGMPRESRRESTQAGAGSRSTSSRKRRGSPGILSFQAWLATTAPFVSSVSRPAN